MNTNQSAYDEIRQTVCEAVQSALSVPGEDVQNDSHVYADLGAESIDQLDIVFRIEKGTGIEIPRNDLIPEDIFTCPDYLNEDQRTDRGLSIRILNAAGREALQRRQPWRSFDHFRQENEWSVGVLEDLIVVDYVRYICFQKGINIPKQSQAS